MWLLQSHCHGLGEGAGEGSGASRGSAPSQGAHQAAAGGSAIGIVHLVDLHKELHEDPHGPLRMRRHLCQHIGNPAPNPGWAPSPRPGSPWLRTRGKWPPMISPASPFICPHFPAEDTVGDGQDVPLGHTHTRGTPRTPLISAGPGLPCSPPAPWACCRHREDQGPDHPEPPPQEGQHLSCLPPALIQLVVDHLEAVGTRGHPGTSSP